MGVLGVMGVLEVLGLLHNLHVFGTGVFSVFVALGTFVVVLLRAPLRPAAVTHDVVAVQADAIDVAVHAHGAVPFEGGGGRGGDRSGACYLKGAP